VTRPSFVSTIAALTARTPNQRLRVVPAEECVDIAAVLRELERTHQGGPVKDDDVDGDYWGRCSTCGERWPCPAWNEGEVLAVQYLGRAQDRVAAHARAVLDRPR
jgi:hypothetical protein